MFRVVKPNTQIKLNDTMKRSLDFFNPEKIRN